MFLLLAVGVVCKVKGLLTDESARSLSNVLLMVIIPAILIRSLQSERADELLPSMAATVVLAILFHAVSIFVANRAFRDAGDTSTAWRVSKLAIVFSNAGFMGFPLLLATVGEVGLLYGALFIGVFNVTSWIWSVPTLTGSRSLSIKQLLATPAVVGFIVAVALYLLNIRLPVVLYSVSNQLASVNTPLSMIVIGVFLASVNPRDALKDSRIYKVLLLRNILLPLFALFCLWAIRIAHWLPGGRVLAIAFMIMVSCPSAANTILMSARYNCDSAHGAKLVAASTAAAIVTMPLLLLLADLVL